MSTKKEKYTKPEREYRCSSAITQGLAAGMFFGNVEPVFSAINPGIAELLPLVMLCRVLMQCIGFGYALLSGGIADGRFGRETKNRLMYELSEALYMLASFVAIGPMFFIPKVKVGTGLTPILIVFSTVFFLEYLIRRFFEDDRKIKDEQTKAS